MTRYFILFAVLMVAIGTATYFYRESSMTAARVDCWTMGDGTGDNRVDILIAGESWAAGGRFFPDLPLALSKTMSGQSVRACSIGYSGRNTGRLVGELKRDFPIATIKNMFDGEMPDHVIIMNGVNDVIQHVGAEFYVGKTWELVEYLADGPRVHVIEIPRVNEAEFRATLLTKIKRYIQAVYYDGGQMVVFDRYRKALKAAHTDLDTIAYDEFIPAYEGNEKRYMPDGIHLTPQNFHQYGAFLGNYLAANTKTHRAAQ